MSSFENLVPKEAEPGMSDDLVGFMTEKYGSTYNCPWERFRRPGPCNLLRWRLWERDHSNIPSQQALDRILPVTPVNSAALDHPPPAAIQVTWIGHASLLVQFDGITILTDPLFRDFCGLELARYLPCLGYWRFRKAACQPIDIPEDKLDAVIISHNHHDHLDLGSVRQVHKRFPGVTWFVPEGMEGWMRDNVSRDVQVRELPWWKESVLTMGKKDFRFIFTPSQHWCQRGAFDMNKCLWGSWVVKSHNHSFYFGGDTGYYQPLFKKIGEKYGPFSLAAIPIGAYIPRYITKYQHVDPAEAVQIHEDINSQMSVSIHWGTFRLTNEFFLEPPLAVEDAMKDRGLDPGKFISLCHGETWVVGEHREPAPFMTRKQSKDSE